MDKRVFFAVLACVAMAFAVAAPVNAQNIDAKEYRLDNGMQVLMVERHEAPTIMASIFARVGSANETTGITGISHLFEHMMFKGTKTIGTKDFKRDQEIMAELDSLRVLMRAEERIMREKLRRGEIDDMLDPEAKTAKTVWFRRDLDNCHGGALLIDGMLFGCGCRAGGKNFYCVDFLTGETIKLDDTLGKVGITAADGRLYCLNHRGTMSLLEVTKKGFEVVSLFELARKPPNYYLAHPVVCGGRLYLRGGPDLFVYDIKAN